MLCVALGLLLAAALAVGGEPGAAWWVAGIFLTYAGFLYAFSPRSEVVSMMSGEAGDERQRSINEQASAASFGVLVVVLVVGLVVATALRSDVAVVFGDLSMLAGLTWVSALVVLTRRGSRG